MAKSIVWLVVVILLLALPGRMVLPALIERSLFVGVFVLVPYVWLLVLAIMSLVRAVRGRGGQESVSE